MAQQDFFKVVSRKLCMHGACASAASIAGKLPTSQFLDGDSAGQRPQVRVGDPGELLLNGLQQVLSNVETLVGVDALLSREPTGFKTV